METLLDIEPRDAGPGPGADIADMLRIDCKTAVEEITAAIRDQLRGTLRRRGVVLGLSGGIDSSVTAALCVRALGPDKVLGLLMPELDSDPESLELGRMLADQLEIHADVEDIGPMLAAMGCYERRDAAIRKLVPEFGAGWGCKVAVSSAVHGAAYTLTYLIVEDPQGTRQKLRMPLDIYLAIVAATNMKQRTRKQLEYYHADRMNHAVAGTPNRLEYDQGFFVKGGDGAADFKPIAHLYKSQVYELAEYLGIPEEIRRRPPTTDTWSIEQTQDEFYFALPYRQMDFCLYGLNHGLPAQAVADAAGLSAQDVERAWTDIASKRKITRYLHTPPLLVEPVAEIEALRPPA